MYVAVNGTTIDISESYGTTNAAGRTENIACHTIYQLDEGDNIEIYIENATAANNIAVTDLSVIVKSLN